MDTYLNFIKELASNVGKLALEKQSHIKDFEYKSPNDIVTEVDIECNEIILNALKEEYPSHTIITEESDIIDNNSEYSWHVDPIDGTANYACGLPIWSVSIALCRNNIPILGVIYFPALDELFHASEGQGAFLNEQRILVTQNDNLNSAMIASASINIGGGNKEKLAIYNSELIRYFEHLSSKVRRILMFGAATYSLCAVAAGRIDAFLLLRLNSYDVAAGAIIVREAQGIVLNLAKSDWKVGDKNLIASNFNLENELKNSLDSLKNTVF